METGSRYRYSRNRCALASGRVPPVLELALAASEVLRQEADQRRLAKVDFSHGG